MTKEHTITIRLTEEELRELERLRDHYLWGTLSQTVRNLAALHLDRMRGKKEERRG